MSLLMSLQELITHPRFASLQHPGVNSDKIKYNWWCEIFLREGEADPQGRKNNRQAQIKENLFLATFVEESLQMTIEKALRFAKSLPK